MGDMNNEIAKVAYELHERRGARHGHDLEDWFEAEKIVLTRSNKGPEKRDVIISSKATAKKRK